LPATRHAPKAMSRTDQNAQAGEYLKRARQSARLSQEQMAMELTEHLGVSVCASAVSYFETATNTIPAAIVFAVHELTGAPLR